jgi:hypothetical protein
MDGWTGVRNAMQILDNYAGDELLNDATYLSTANILMKFHELFALPGWNDPDRSSRRRARSFKKRVNFIVRTIKSIARSNREERTLQPRRNPTRTCRR